MPKRVKYHVVDNKKTIGGIVAGLIVIAVIIAGFYFVITDAGIGLCQVHVTLSTEGSGTVTPTGYNAFACGTSFTANAYSTGASFVNWIVSGDILTPSSSSLTHPSITLTTYSCCEGQINPATVIAVFSDAGSSTSTSSSTTKSTTTTSISPSISQSLQIVTLSPGSLTVSQGSTIFFNAQVAGGQQPYSYAWQFGDGGTASAQNPNHQYTIPGQYTTILQVTDNAGKLSSGSMVITVSPGSQTSSSVQTTHSSPTTQGPTVVTTTFLVSSDVTTVMTTNGQQTTITYGTTFATTQTSTEPQGITSGTELLIGFLVVVFAAVIGATIVAQFRKNR